MLPGSNRSSQLPVAKDELKNMSIKFKDWLTSKLFLLPTVNNIDEAMRFDVFPGTLDFFFFIWDIRRRGTAAKTAKMKQKINMIDWRIKEHRGRHCWTPEANCVSVHLHTRRWGLLSVCATLLTICLCPSLFSPVSLSLYQRLYNDMQTKSLGGYWWKMKEKGVIKYT